MLSKIIKTQKNSLSKANFSSLKKTIDDLFEYKSTSKVHHKAAAFDPLKPVESHEVVLKNDQQPKYEVSHLKNGVTVLTESIIFPNVIDLGILLNVGARDETLTTSGSLLALKNNYHRTLLSLNRKSHDLIETSGGEIDMDYDQENTYFKANCLSHHVDDILSTMVDAALKPTPYPTAETAIMGIRDHYNMLEQMGSDGEDLNDAIMRAAYGQVELGMPINGIKDNLRILSPETLQNFQKEVLSSNRVFICAAGVEDHQEFVRLVETKLSSVHLPEKSARNRNPSVYKGGEIRKDNGNEEATLSLTFKTVPWTNNDIFAFQVLNTLLGSSASFSTGGPGKGMHSRTTKNLLNRLSYVDSANSVCANFSDTGLFGLTLSGPASNANDLLRALTNELRGLAQPIPAIELQRAKNISKSNILMALERQKDRLEESVKNIKTFGRLSFHEYCNNVDKVTSEQINLVVSRMLMTPPTFVAEGAGVSRLPNYDKIQNMLRI